MKAIRYLGKEKIGFVDVPPPELKAGEALIEVKYAGICGSDLFIYSGTHPRAKAPLVIGHEFCGVVIEIADDDPSGFKVGDRVTANPHLACGECDACLAGHRNVCRQLKIIGIDLDGAFAEYVAIDTSYLIRLPEGIAFDKAALSEPLAVAVHAVRGSDMKLGDRVLVLGGGSIGLLTAFAAKANGASVVVVVEPNEFRRKLAAGFGFQMMSDPQDFAQGSGVETGFDVVFEAAGVPATIEAAIKYCRIKGQVVIIGLYKYASPVDLRQIAFAELKLAGTRANTNTDFVVAADLLNKYPEISDIVTHRLPFEEAQTGFDLLRQGGDVVKVLLHP
ncbi:MAG: alcohol dehydrogenase catalytic domain-containing protein [Negativicutes bacterium]|nr:alcohol dehydrogenase catalytic domain-containing protein [Negativicutes bacterium]